MEVKNKIVIVTGAGSGIGKATSIHLANHGATVVVSDINIESAEKVVLEIIASGGTASANKCNVANFKEVEQLIHSTVQKYERLDVIVNNAGIGPNLLRTHEASLKDWDIVVAVNQTGVFYCMKVALQQFLVQGYGNIVNIASLAGLKASPNNISYSASKFAVVGMTKSAAMEYATKNIRVNCVSPGGMKAKQSNLFIKRYRKSCNLKGLLDGKDISKLILFLLSDQSKYIAGQNLVIDDGWSL